LFAIDDWRRCPVDDANPYEPSSLPATPPPKPVLIKTKELAAKLDPPSAISTYDTIGPRYIASGIDNLLAAASMLACAKLVSDEYPALQVVVFLTTYFNYFLLLEWLTGRTVGKLLLGVVVVRFDGGRPRFWQILVRTLLRIVEVNPVLCGAIPAGVLVLISPNRQRLGDRLAGTVVVRTWRWRKFLREQAA
jgi:uncharacterized RDD family membrane protein YckC